MGWILDTIAVLLLLLSAAVLTAGVWLVIRHQDLAAVFALIGGFVMMRSSVDLLRPRRTK